MNEIQILKQRVEFLERSNNELREMLAIKGYLRTSGPIFPPGTYSDNAGFRTEVALTGNAQNIIVPSFPSKFIELRNHAGLYLPVHEFSI